MSRSVRRPEELNVLDYEEVEAGREAPITPLSFLELTGVNPFRRGRSQQPSFPTVQEAINNVKVRRPEEWNVLDHEEFEAGWEDPITPLSFLEATRANPVRRGRSRQPRFPTSQKAVNTVKVRRPEEWNVLGHEEVEAGWEEPITPLSFLESTGVNPVRRGRSQRPGLQRFRQDQEDQKRLNVCKRIQGPTLHGSTGNIIIQDSRIKIEGGREEPITPYHFLSATGRHPVRRDRPQQGHKDQRGIRVCKRTQEPTLHRSTRNTVDRLLKVKSTSLLYREYLDRNC